jgi:NADH:ubiquinone oxidoreductase subunit F (NADH-binding)
MSGYGRLAERPTLPAGPPASPAGLPRLLAGIPARGALSLGEHLALHGALPPLLGSPPPRGRRGSSALIDLVEAAGLRGYGGAGFPLATKLRAVAGASRSTLGGRPIVVVNGAEGEPASSKDRTLLRSLPHLVLDGALLAAAAVGAHEILLGVCESAPAALDACALALAERGAPSRGAPTVQLVAVPSRYVAGQESALVSFLGGGSPLPTFTPPRPFERGVRGRPTLVSNVETLAHLALLARHGPDWFRELGTPAQPGSALVTLSGPVAFPGVYEIEHGSPLTALLDAAEGATAPLRAVLLGGYSGTWIDASLLRGVALSDEHLAPHGATLGTGVVVLLSAAACPVAELARLVRWLASESARQCGPCMFGLDSLASTFEQLVLGDAPSGHGGRASQKSGVPGGRDATGGRGAIPRIATLAGLVNRRGACSHPDGAARLVASALDVFAEELADHAHHGPCAACARPSELPRPRAAVGDGNGAGDGAHSSATRAPSRREGGPAPLPRLASPSRR